MLRDFGIFRRNSGRNGSAGANVENVDPVDGSAPLPGTESFRAPLSTVLDPEATPKLDPNQEGVFKRKLERTPSKVSQVRAHDAAAGVASLRTPEKPPAAATPAGTARNRFGWAMRNEGGICIGRAGEDTSFPVAGTSQLLPVSRGGSSAVGVGFGLTTPRLYKTAGKASSVYSESSSTQSTPTKSVNKPPNPGLAWSRPSLGMSNRVVNSASATKGIPISSLPTSVVNTVEVPHFELREDPSFWLDHNVQVVIRVRPHNSTERSSHGYNRCLKQESSQSVLWIGQPETRFTFDHVACETINQETLFRVVGLPMVENCMSGYNSCVFAYGQTGSGKTYTMLGEIDDLDSRPSPERGMTPRIFEFLFARIRAEEESRRDEKLRYNCKCSFLEIYNEQITDLLDSSSTNLLLREDVRKGVYVENLSEFEVETVNDILRLLVQGAASRKIAATNMNRESSRSHCVFTCVIESRWEKDSTTNLRFARLNLVDLAGSERQKTSGAEGDRLKEAANINKSLSTLGHVIMVLVDVARGKQRHVPYRDSRLTFLLQDSLGGNSKTMIIANVSPSICCASETLSTLKFAQRAKLIQNNAIINEDATGDVIALQHQIKLLKEELSVLKHQNVSRSLSFRTAILRDSDSERCDAPHMVVPEESQAYDGHDVHGYEGSSVSSKQLNSLETVLAGALRREKVADTTIKKLEAEIEQLNRLVWQREEDNQCSKMMLKFREDKIHRMESLVDDLMPAESYLLAERNLLVEEIQLLRSKVDRNPEVTRFALENIRLLDQLRRFQDFYEEGERELLLSEVSELRDELVRLLEGKLDLDKNPNLITEAKPVHAGTTDASAECDALRMELKKTCEELEDSRNKLKCCLKLNGELTREVDGLQMQLKSVNTLREPDADSDDMELSSGFSPMGSHLCDSQTKRMDDSTISNAEQIVHLQLELDILKTIFAEERGSHAELEERALCDRDKLLMAEEKILEMSKHYEDAKSELSDARSIIDALESQQLLLITELEELRESNKLRLEYVRKQHLQMSSLEDDIESRWENNVEKSLMPQQPKQPSLKCLGNDSPLQVKTKGMRATFKNGRVLNITYQDDKKPWTSDEQEMEEICREVEAETAEVIMCLQEEISTLRQQVEDSNKSGMVTSQSFTELEMEMREVQEKLYLVTEDNERLNDLIELKDEQLRSLSEEWERIAFDIVEALADGNAALEDASYHSDSIIDSLVPRDWVGKQVGRMIRAISEKDALIGELQGRLDDAQKALYDMDWKLHSLRGATLAITEAQQQENNHKEREILQLTLQLSEKSSTISRLENSIKLGEEQIKKAEILASVAFMTVNRMSEINSVHLEALEGKEIQVNYYATLHLHKDAILQDVSSLNAELRKQIQASQLQLVEYEDKITRLQLKLTEEQERVCVLECQLEKTNRVVAVSQSVGDLLELKEKINEFKLGVSTLYMFVNQYVEQTEQLAGEHTPEEHVFDGSGSWARIESISCASTVWCKLSRVGDDNTNSLMCNTTNDSSQCKVKAYTSAQEHLECEMTIDACGRETAVLLLQTEIDSAIVKLKAVQDQMNKLLDEKEKIKEFEMQSRKMIEDMTAQMIRMENDIVDKERQFELRLLELDRKIRTVVGKARESIACWKETKQELELELRDAKFIADQKTMEASTILAKFEEAQETMREANIMVNALVAANESANLEVQRCLKRETMLTCERDFLVSQVHDLQSSFDMKNEEYADLEKKFHSQFSDLFQLRASIFSFESVIKEVQITFGEELKSVIHDIHFLKSQVSHYTSLAGKWLEDIWSELIGKDCAVSVLHLCHMGIMLEIITGLNAENGLLHCGICESNAIIADLRAHNDRAKKELETCSILKGKLLADINNAFGRIIRKESDRGEWKTKLDTLEKKIMALQLQEESMLARSNSMGAELAVLLKEFDRNKNALEELYFKDVELLIFTSELKDKIVELKLKSVNLCHLERKESSLNVFIEKLKEEMYLLLVGKELDSGLFLDIEADNAILKKELKEAHSQLEVVNHDSFKQLREKDEMINQMQVKLETFECHLQKIILQESESKDEISRLQLYLEEKCTKLTDLEESHDRILKELTSKILEFQLVAEQIDAGTAENSKLKSELAETEETKGRLFTQFELLQNEKVGILEDLKLKEADLQSSSCALSVLSQENHKLQDEIHLLHVLVSNMKDELEKKGAEVTDIKNSSSVMGNDLQLERDNIAALTCKLDVMQGENEKLKNEMLKMTTENSRAIDFFQKKGSELGFSFSCISDSSPVTSNLMHIILSLYNLICSAQTELNMKNSLLDELQHSHSLLSKKLEYRTQEQELQNVKATALKIENETLSNEIVSVIKKKEEMINLFSFNHQYYSDFMQSVDMILNATSQMLEGSNMTLMEKIIQDFSEYGENASMFLENVEFLEVAIKELLSENLFLRSELTRKDEESKNLLFDLHSLQELASSTKSEKDKNAEMAAILQSVEDELASKSNELHEAVALCQMLESQIEQKINMMNALELDCAKESESRKLLSGENVGLKAQIEKILLMKDSLGKELSEKSQLLEKLEMELNEARALRDKEKHFLESLQNEIFKVTDERESLDSMVLDLKEQLEMTHALVEENEAIAVEARQIAESKKAYADEKEEEVRLYERSVEELECTVNMLENKVENLNGEVERQRLQREDLEMELQELRNKMVSLQNSSDSHKIAESRCADLLRHVDEKVSELQDAEKQINSLQKDVADKEAEIIQCKAHIFELNMHAEAQARENKQRIKELETMAQQVSTESSSSHTTSLTSNKHEKTAVKSRGSGSPFKCIGLGLTQQINSEKDEELSAARTRIAELESLAARQQKEIFMLNARLANSESMTHDAIRDLLGVKLAMTNYASLLDEPRLQKVVEAVAYQSDVSEEKEEIANLKKQMDEFIEERQGWLDEINRRHKEVLAARTAIEKLQQREQFLTSENEMLKGEIVKHNKMVSYLEDEIKKLQRQQTLQQRIHHHAKIKEENCVLKIENRELLMKLRRSEEILSCVKEELACYRISCGKSPYVDIDKEQRLKNKLENAEEERVQLAQKLLSLCTNILKVAGITRPASEVSLAMAEEVLNQLKDRLSALECELQDLQLKSKICGEKVRLSELRQQSSSSSPPFSRRNEILRMN